MDAGPMPMGHYPFLNHSSSTLPNNLPPNVDDKPLARQKRKRTSPEDQATLEAAYKRDPKPDKTARLELVKHVGLGEKEVQIWFQNRRQSSRRKSRPLLPHEVAQYQMSRFGTYSPDMTTEQPIGVDEEDGVGWDGSGELPEQDANEGLPRPVVVVAGEQQRSVFPERAFTERQPTSQPPAHDAPVGHHIDTGALGPLQGPLPDPGQNPAFGIPEPPVRLADQRRPLSHPISQPQNDTSSAAQPAARADPCGCLKKAPSYVRLSMSSDGNASVVTKDGSSPSPPRASHVNLARSNISSVSSAHSSRPGEAASDTAPSKLQRTSSGRSRDSRTWEFWCDKDARRELEEKAKQDSSGSAANAIGLLRSASGRSILGAIPAKRNSLMLRPSEDVKRSKLGSKRPPLQRSNTSFGRLQGKSDDVDFSYPKAKSKLKHSESAVSVYIPGNESDKENWSPDSDRPYTSHAGTFVNASGRAPAKPVLGQSHNAVNAARGRSRGHGAAKDRFTGGPDSENADPEADAELATFMRGGRTSASMSSDDDLDCVQGLLRLSQGAWR